MWGFISILPYHQKDRLDKWSKYFPNPKKCLKTNLALFNALFQTAQTDQGLQNILESYKSYNFGLQFSK